MNWIPYIAGGIGLVALVAWLLYVRGTLARDAELHVKGKKPPQRLSTYGDGSDL